ncbi:MAG TPA: DEAD/DEAH box helicase family protein [Bacillota bacterium]
MTTPLFSHTQSVYFSGKLLLRQEIPLAEKNVQQLMETGQLTAIPSISQTLFSSKCNRCGNRIRALFGHIPCQRCQTTHLYCRKCIEMGRVLACEPLYVWTGKDPDWPIHEQPCTWEGDLTDVQQRAADRLVQAVQNEEHQLLIWAVCGAGKTEMLFPGIAFALERGKRICIATPRVDVVRELLPRLKQAFAIVHVQGLYGGSEEKDGTAQLIVATTHQLIRYKRAFDVVIIDEMDAFPYHTDSSLPFVTERAKKQRGTMVYLTATPRAEQRYQLLRKKLPHIFVPIRFHGHALPVPTMKMCLSLQKYLQRGIPPTCFLTWLKQRKHSSRQLLLFVPTIALAEQLKQGFTEQLLRNGVVHYPEQVQAVHSEDDQREQKITAFRKGHITFLLTTTILERGVTFPSIDVAVLDAGHDVFDEAALVQIAGRAGRSAQDPTGEVAFFHDGKTDAMVEAIRLITFMNKRGGV